MFSFFKKAKTFIIPAGFVFDGYKEPERHYIPKDHISEIIELVDDCMSSSEYSQSRRYALWVEISDIFPELDIQAGGWHFNCDNILRPYVYKD